jgi:hypothetical protein
MRAVRVSICPSNPPPLRAPLWVAASAILNPTRRPNANTSSDPYIWEAGAAANRDASEFPEPDRCVLDRQANRHLGFGAGVHRCLGSNLARLEFQIGLEQVLARMPDYTISLNAAAVFHGNSVTRGFRSIPVVFTPSQVTTDTP